VWKISCGWISSLLKMATLEFTISFHVFAEQLHKKTGTTWLYTKGLDMLFTEAMLQ
jgi:hypothetical protein